MPDLENNCNIYANLAQVAYPRGDASFSQELIIEKRYTPTQIIFPHAKDAYGNDASKVYLQPDKLETIKEKSLFGDHRDFSNTSWNRRNKESGRNETRSTKRTPDKIS